MPIIVNAVPYLWLIDSEVKRDSLETALVDYMAGSLTSDNTLQLLNTTQTLIWRALAGEDFPPEHYTYAYIVRPDAEDGYSIFGEATWTETHKIDGDNGQ
jgi:hypothetical protein